MKKFTIILIALLKFTLVTGQTYSSIISDKEIYDFLNWITIKDKKHAEEKKLKRKRIQHEILSWDITNFTLKDTVLFNQEDRGFLLKQITSIKDTIWHSRFSKSKLLINKKQKHPNKYYYSIPLFFQHKDYVIVQRHYYCGNLCAYGGYYIYRRLDNKKWLFVTALNTWIS